ncbi:IS3 family transposase [Leisingera aquaemixtae]|uniref:IS3 family transposase n=1 Tax=Leisingera aquaemixtae TaxID=1396826 RepID=UPI0021A578E5|nr:IS3 family transposase [Leisingera aquaemixtae]UWQ45847.1 IS3 family transposase [Leisingera aquaemixtae]
MGNGNRPTPEFRREAVRLALTSGLTRREVADDLGIGLSTLTRWVRQDRDAEEPAEAQADLRAELKRLRKENAVLKQERDILKKAAAFSASMSFAFIEAEKASSPISRMCQTLGVSQSGFFAWRERPACRRQRHDMVYLAYFRTAFIGWATSDRLKRSFAVEALRRAIVNRNPAPGLVHHSDRGSQYCSVDYQAELRKRGILISMSSKGSCYDNSMVETFFKTIKSELIWPIAWHTREQAENAIARYIDGFYNPVRRHSSLGFKSPIAFEREALEVR